jgi:hypothetical protein
MQVKSIEVRDSMTFIPCMAILMIPNLPQLDIDCSEEETRMAARTMLAERYLLRRAGYDFARPLVMFGRMHSGEFNHDYYNWGSNNTMKVAHKYVEENWDSLRTGDVVDVEFIMGLTKQPKNSERYDHD